MRDQRPQGDWVIILTLFVAGLLQVVPLPEALAPGRPAWVCLALIYWVFALPHRIGVFWGFAVGLFLDVLTGTVLGQHGLSLALVAYIMQVSNKRLRVFAPLQQSVVVALVVSVSVFLEYLVQDAVGRMTYPVYWVLLTGLVSGLFWRPVYLVLRWVRRRMQVR